MGEISHTPAPWAIGGVLQNTGDVTISAPALGIVIADVHNAASFGDFMNAALTKRRFGHADDADTQWANARLIAAAPEMLEAGRALYAAIGDWRKPENGFLTPDLIAAGVKWCAALAKAEGPSPQTQGGV